MRITVETLVDITETKARKGDDKLLVNQQANFMTVMQTASLRVNITPLSLEEHVSNVDKLGFGKNFKGKQKYWTFSFEHDVPKGLTEELLKNDFDLVPFISNLNETVTIKHSVFRTFDPQETNIIFKFFEIDDK